MARYYFDLWEDSSLLTDPEGLELPSTRLAEQEALRAALAVAEESFNQGSKLVTLAVREGDTTVMKMSVRLEVERPEERSSRQG